MTAPAGNLRASAPQARALRRLEAARDAQNERGIAEALWALTERTPLFADLIVQVEDWIRESRDLAVRWLAPRRQEVGQIIRSAEVFLARGAALEAYNIAREACASSAHHNLPGLEDWAWMVSARASVRLGRQEEAIAMFARIASRELPAKLEEPIVPGLAFLALGEAQLFEGRYEGACEPLERALGALPAGAFADRYRYDALVGLGMLEHRAGRFHLAAHRYEAAMGLADKHASRPELVESLLLMGSLQRGRGEPALSDPLLTRALQLSATLESPSHPLIFPTARLRNLVGASDRDDMQARCMEHARHCGVVSDLMGYVQLTTIVAALYDHGGQHQEARSLLKEVAAGLAEGGQGHAAAVLRQHLAAYQAA